MERPVATAASRFAFRATACGHPTSPARKRLMTTGRGARRASVDGVRMPAATSINLEEMEEVLNKVKEEKEKKTKEVEHKVDSELNKSNKKSPKKE